MIPNWKQVIFHVDLDCFFVASHIKRNLYLKGFPVIVGSDPKKGLGRGVVSTCSYEARKFGVRSGMAISIAYQKCPQAVYICSYKKVGFNQYKDDSEEVMTFLRSITSNIRQASIDEAYLDVSDNWKKYGDTPLELAKFIQKHIMKELSLSISIGIAETRQIAKIASDINKPYGIAMVPTNKLPNLIWPLPVKRISGVGKVSSSNLNKKGIYKIGDLAKLSTQQAFHLIGKYGLHLREIAIGEGSKTIKSKKVDRKSIGAERTFPKDVDDWNTIMEKTASLTKDLCSKLKTRKLGTKTIAIKIRFDDYTTFTRAKSIRIPINDWKNVFRVISDLLNEFRTNKKNKSIRLIGVRLASLHDYKHQLPLEKFYKKNNINQNLNIPTVTLS